MKWETVCSSCGKKASSNRMFSNSFGDILCAGCYDPIKERNVAMNEITVGHNDYMALSDAYDKHSRTLVSAKGEEYSVDGDFLAMENRLAGMVGSTPEFVSLVMAGKHVTALGIIMEKNNPSKINLEKWDERIRDGMNLLKIDSAFIHARQNDFSLHLGKEEKEKDVAG